MTRVSHTAAENGGRGFSLIELLVVMFILSLLAGLLLPSLFKAKLLAKKVACMAGFSTLGKAAGLYQSDYKEHVPVCPVNYEPTPAKKYPWKTWRVNLFPYVSDVAAFNCPAADNGGNGLEIITSYDQMAAFDSESEAGTMNIGSYGVIWHEQHDTYIALTVGGGKERASPDKNCAYPVTPGVYWEHPENSIYLTDARLLRGEVQYPTQAPYKGGGTSCVYWPSGSIRSEKYWSFKDFARRFCDRHLGTNCLFLDGRVEDIVTEELDNMAAGTAECVWDWK